MCSYRINNMEWQNITITSHRHHIHRILYHCTIPSITSHHNTLYRTSYHIVSTWQCIYITSYHITSNHIISHHITSHHITSHNFACRLSHHIVSNDSINITSSVIHCIITSHHIKLQMHKYSHPNTSHHTHHVHRIASNDSASHHITSHHITSHHITSNDILITSHHTTSH
jgi:hypothetical protein